MTIDMAVSRPNSVGRTSYKDVFYLLDFSDQMGVVIEVNNIAKEEAGVDPLEKAEVYLSVIKDYSNFKKYSVNLKKELRENGEEYSESVQPGKFFWRVLKKEAEYSDGPADREIIRMIF